jgi:hypothetical protein
MQLQQATFLSLVAEKVVWFFDGEGPDFEKCPHCAPLLPTHKASFITLTVDHLPKRKALDQKLSANGLLTKGNRLLAKPVLGLAIAATTMDLTCVLEAGPALIDRFAVCSAATVETMPASEFLEILALV